MKLCGWCEKRIWPWQHYGFRVMPTGEARWHVACGAKVDRIFDRSSTRWRTGTSAVGAGGPAVTKPMDPELKAIKAILRAIAPLEEKAQQRIIWWLVGRFGA